MKSLISLVILSVFVVSVTQAQTAPDTSSRKKIYWTDIGTGEINIADLDGSNIQTLAAGVAPWVVALDVAGSKMYWVSWSRGLIRRANLDGSSIENLVTGVETIEGIALDVKAGKMYWTLPGKIQHANLDGSSIENLVTGLSVPDSIALDLAAGKMYWTDVGTNKIQRANLDGSNIEDLVTSQINFAQGLSLDVAAGKMYWTNWPPVDKIQRANLDGSNIEDLVTGIRGLEGLALDVAAGKMYWTDFGAGKIQRANLDGSNIEDLVTTGLGQPIGITLGLDTTTAPNSKPQASTQVAGDVNGDNVVNIQDLTLIAARFGRTGKDAADVNGDGVVNIADLVLVAAALGAGAAAPSVHAELLELLTAADVHLWLLQARQSISDDATYRRGVLVLEQLLSALAPKTSLLLPNYPNPFNPETWIPYELAAAAEVTVTIHASDGRLVRTLALGQMPAGVYQSRSRAAYWDGRSAQGEPVASGVYFYTLTAGDFSATRKMVIRK